jgi:alpha-methylacyl-CoA racemase
VADIGAGTYPAVVNILLALRQRDRTGRGCCIDVAMAENLFTFMFWGLAMGEGTGVWPRAGAEQLSGGSPRYRIYRTADGRHLAVAALEDKFWHSFCELAQVPAALRDDARDPQATMNAVDRCVASRDAAAWEALLEHAETCCTVVRTLEEGVRDLHFAARNVFARQVALPGHVLPALPVPVVAALRRTEVQVPAPTVGQDTSRVLRVAD